MDPDYIEERLACLRAEADVAEIRRKKAKRKGKGRGEDCDLSEIV